MPKATQLESGRVGVETLSCGSRVHTLDLWEVLLGQQQTCEADVVSARLRDVE